jgi:type VI secretion system protein VasD
MTRGFTALFLSLAFALSIGLAGCGSPPPPPTVADITITAAADANPDASGQGAPVAVRVYQLASTSNFDKADFFQLFQHEQETLGADLIARDEILVTPGSTQQLHKELKPGAAFIGVVAAFRDIEKATWRGEVAPPAHQTTAVQAVVQGLNLAVTMAPGAGS